MTRDEFYGVMAASGFKRNEVTYMLSVVQELIVEETKAGRHLSLPHIGRFEPADFAPGTYKVRGMEVKRGKRTKIKFIPAPAMVAAYKEGTEDAAGE